MTTEILFGARLFLKIFENHFQIRDEYEKVYLIPYQAWLIFKKSLKIITLLLEQAFQCQLFGTKLLSGVIFCKSFICKE